MTDTLPLKLAAIAGTRDYDTLPHSCRCGSRWAGVNTCHCAAPQCHRTFTGVDGFDRHRKGGECVDPAAIGMSLAAGRAYDAWSLSAAQATSEVAA